MSSAISDSAIKMQPIGYVRSCYKQRFGTPRQSDLVKSAEAWIELASQIQPEFSLSGLEGFSHLWVIFYFHKNTNQKFSAKVHPPRLEGENIGVYATRSPHRPNSIGLSLVEIKAVEKNRVQVVAHDLIDGTPVLDLKPYLKESECKPHARSGWAEAKKYTANLDVIWRHEARTFVDQNISDPERFFRLVDETLALDPRPMLYKMEDNKLRERHAVRFDEWDVFFEFPQPGVLEIVEVMPWPHD